MSKIKTIALAVACLASAYQPARALPPVTDASLPLTQRILKTIGHTPKSVAFHRMTPNGVVSTTISWKRAADMIGRLSAGHNAPGVSPACTSPSCPNFGQGLGTGPYCDDSSAWNFFVGPAFGSVINSTNTGPKVPPTTTCGGVFGPTLTWVQMTLTSPSGLISQGCWATQWLLLEGGSFGGYCNGSGGLAAFSTFDALGSGVLASFGFMGYTLDAFIGNKATVTKN